MATVSEPRRKFDSVETQRRVRHPLQAVRGYIRWYVVLEGSAIAVIFLALWFWVGLALDFGAFKLWAFDWIQELQEATMDAQTGRPSALDGYLRLGLLGALLACLLGVVAWQVFLRLFREFGDRALALVLERRFRRELGDRLITAIELADPKESEKIGYSPALLEETIMDAAERVGKLPVKEVFDWVRLQRLWLWCGALTLGMYVLVGIGTSVIGAVSGGSASPFDFMWRFNDVAGIWGERSLLLQDSYWPRRAHLELVRFQEAQSRAGEMRVPRDEQRADVQVRAIRWVVADRSAADGWRPLRWSDLERFVPQEQLAKVAIPRDWAGWIVDFDDLPASVPTALVPSSWQGKTSGEIQAELAFGAYRDAFKRAGAEPLAEELFGLLYFNGRLGVEGQRLRALELDTDVAALLDWQHWTIDRLDLQARDRAPVRQALRQQHLEAYGALEKLFADLGALADSARLSRRLRHLEAPQRVMAYFRGDNAKITKELVDKVDNKYTVSLDELKESVRFRVRGDDYYTPVKKITLVPPPSLRRLAVDKKEPAYIYWRLQGDQAKLKDMRQIFSDYTVSVDGDVSTIRVPIGTSLVLHAEADRKLKKDLRIRAPLRSDESGSYVPERPPVLKDDGATFSLPLDRIVRTYDFFVEFNDLDGVKGQRRIKVVPTDDRPPEILDFELMAILRKPRFKSDPARTSRGIRPDGFLITPDALLPFRGTVKDDYGLTRVAWAYDVEQVYFELVGAGALGTLKKDKSQPVDMAKLRVAIAAFQSTPGNIGLTLTAPFLQELIKVEWATKLPPRKDTEEERLMEAWANFLAGREVDEIPVTALAKKLTERPTGRLPLREHQLKDEIGFDVRRFLPKLKTADPSREAQFHYLLEVAVKATDNNIESGPNVGRPKSGFSFLVVSENELLSQIAIEEEVLRDRLEKVYNRLKTGKTLMEEQIKKLESPGVDLTLVSLRVDDVRKAVGDSASNSREIHGDYARILKELDVNQVRVKHSEVKIKIVEPLEEVVNSEWGAFATAEMALQHLYQGVDDDLNAKKGDANRAVHLSNARTADDQVNRLMFQINKILIAMEEGMVYARALDMLLRMEQDQRSVAEFLTRWRLQVELEILDKAK